MLRNLRGHNWRIDRLRDGPTSYPRLCCMGGRSSIYHSVVDLVYCVAIPATQVQEKTPKSELEASLKRLATIQKEEGDILIASKDSKYAAGMRINLEILQKD